MKSTIFASFCSALFLLAPDVGNAAGSDPPQTAPLASVMLQSEPSGVLDVPVELKGRIENFRLYLGSNTTAVADSVATQLQLPRDHVPYHEFVLFAGFRLTEYAEPDALRFGTFSAPRTRFFVVPDRTIPLGIAGMLGSDYLKQFDVELDFVGGKLSLYSPGGCASVAGEVTILPIDVSSRGRITVNVQLDGKAATAMIDSGIPFSILTLDRAKDMFGFNEKTPGLKAVAQHGGLAYLVSYPFKTLALGKVSLSNPDILIQTNLRQPEITLGASVLRRLHLCIGYESEKLYVIQ